MVLLDRHLGMLAERQPRNVVVVLRGNGKDDAAVAEPQRRLLHGEMRLAGRVALPDHDAFEPVIADDAAPQRVVEIEDEAAAALAAQRRDDAADMIGVERQEDRRERQLRHVPQGRIVPALEPHRLRQRGDVEHEVGRARDARGDAAVDAVDEVPQRARQAEIEAAELGLERARNGLEDGNRPGILVQPGADRVEMLQAGGDRRLGLPRHRPASCAAAGRDSRPRRARRRAARD